MRGLRDMDPTNPSFCILSSFYWVGNAILIIKIQGGSRTFKKFSEFQY